MHCAKNGYSIRDIATEYSLYLDAWYIKIQMRSQVFLQR